MIVPDWRLDKSMAKKDATTQDFEDFESALKALEALVQDLEKGDLKLEKSLSYYEKGVKLSNYCHDRLKDAERRIDIVNKDGKLEPAQTTFDADPSLDNKKSK
jgi:exodeoxyribonuclease VII small subunit